MHTPVLVHIYDRTGTHTLNLAHACAHRMEFQAAGPQCHPLQGQCLEGGVGLALQKGQLGIHYYLPARRESGFF